MPHQTNRVETVNALDPPRAEERRGPAGSRPSGGRLAALLGIAVILLQASCAGKKQAAAERPRQRPVATAKEAKPEPPASRAVEYPVSLLTLVPAAAEYGTKPDPEKIQTRSGPGVIDTTPVPPRNNASWFWPGALKIVTALPAEDFEFPEGQAYGSARTDLFASEGFFLTGVGLWGRTRNMYHWVDYDVPPGATRFTGDVFVTDDPFGWFAGMKDSLNQQFECFVQVDGQDVFRQGATRHRKLAGSGEKLHSLDLPLPAGAKRIRFGLEVTPWGAGNKNIELVITEGMFHGDTK